MGDEWATSCPGCITPGKEPTVPLHMRFGGPWRWSGCNEEEKYHLPLPGLEP